MGTKLSGVHLGHSEQPSPEEVTRTVAPVTAIPALTTTLPRAQARSDLEVGFQMVRARRARVRTPTNATAICHPQRGTPRRTMSSISSAASGGRVCAAVVTAAGEANIRQTVVHRSGSSDVAPPSAATCGDTGLRADEPSGMFVIRA